MTESCFALTNKPVQAAFLCIAGSSLKSAILCILSGEGAILCILCILPGGVLQKLKL